MPTDSSYNGCEYSSSASFHVKKHCHFPTTFDLELIPAQRYHCTPYFKLHNASHPAQHLSTSPHRPTRIYLTLSTFHSNPFSFKCINASCSANPCSAGSRACLLCGLKKTLTSSLLEVLNLWLFILC